MILPKTFKTSMATALVASLLAVAGCGGGSSSSPSSPGQGTAEFAKHGADKATIKFGKEAPESEREAASSVLEKNLAARAAADFTTQCATLNLKTIEEIVGEASEDPAAECPDALKKLAEPLSASRDVRKNTLDGSIAALRVKGNQGYALYHGNDGNDYSMSMEKEDGEWKVGSLVTAEL